MYSACKLNKQGDNIQPWCTPFPVLNQFIVPCPFLTNASWAAYRFLRRQVRWSGISISLRIFQFGTIHTVKGFSVVNEADVFFGILLIFSMIQQLLTIWSLVSAFSKFSLNIWKFLVHILLKPSLKDFEHYLASVWNECNCEVISTLFGITLLWHFGMKTDLFQFCGHCWVF